jgi:hypothetical protein
MSTFIGRMVPIGADSEDGRQKLPRSVEERDLAESGVFDKRSVEQKPAV